jgi:hypothetical protein
MNGKHAARHAKETEISPFALRVKLAPDMAEELVNVLKAVNSSPHVSAPVMEMGWELAAGQQDLLTALTTMRFLNQEVEKHHRAEGGEAAGLLADFMRKVSTSCELDSPFTLVQAETKRGRG